MFEIYRKIERSVKSLKIAKFVENHNTRINQYDRYLIRIQSNLNYNYFFFFSKIIKLVKITVFVVIIRWFSHVYRKIAIRIKIPIVSKIKHSVKNFKMSNFLENYTTRINRMTFNLNLNLFDQFFFFM